MEKNSPPCRSSFALAASSPFSHERLAVPLFFSFHLVIDAVIVESIRVLLEGSCVHRCDLAKVFYLFLSRSGSIVSGEKKESKQPLFLITIVFRSPYLGVRGLFRGLEGDVPLESPLGTFVSIFSFVVVIVGVGDAESVGHTSRRSDWPPLVLFVVVAVTAASFRR